MSVYQTGTEKRIWWYRFMYRGQLIRRSTKQGNFKVAKDMARYAIELLGDNSRLQQMAKQARADAKARFCTSKIIPLYEEFYRRVLERSS